MKCPNPQCNNTDHEPGAKFCQKCGWKLSATPVPKPPEPIVNSQDDDEEDTLQKDIDNPNPELPKPIINSQDEDEEDTLQKDPLSDIKDTLSNALSNKNEELTDLLLGLFFPVILIIFIIKDKKIRPIGILYFIVGVLIFFFYAHEKFGLMLGILYSLYWVMSVAIQLIIWLFTSLFHLIIWLFTSLFHLIF